MPPKRVGHKPHVETDPWRPSPAIAEDFDFHGSLGPNSFTRYVPPLSNPLFNGTPYITS